MMRPRVKHLFTDASCIHQRGIASWAGMIVDEMTSELRCGLIRVALRNGTAAEAHGVRIALRTFIAAGRIAPGDTIIIHCDSQAVINQIANGRAPKPKERHFRSQIERIRRTAEQYQLALCGQWIKAHQGYDSTDLRSLINQRVDRAAKAVSRAENLRRCEAGDTGRLKAERLIAHEAAQ